MVEIYMPWEEALDVVIADTREDYPGELESDVEVLFHVWNTITLDQVVRYDLETDDPNDKYARNAVAHLVFLGQYQDPTRHELYEIIKLLTREEFVHLTRLQELWIYMIQNGRMRT